MKILLRNKLLIFLSALSFSACHDDISDSVVPEYNVHYSCNATTINAILQQTKQPNLDTPGGYVRVYDKQNIHASDIIGVGGLLILQSYDNQFFAFDLACPYCYSQGETGTRLKRIDIGDDGMKACCRTCDSEFGAIFWGSPAPTSGPANKEKLILRQYKARRTGDGTTITITR